MQTWFINGRNMGHAELLRWRASQALKVEAEVVEPKKPVEPDEPQEPVLPEEKVVEVEVEKVVEVSEVSEVSEVPEASKEVKEAEEAKELGELETPPIIKPFCDFCDAKGPIKHKKDCPTLKK